MNEQTQNKLRVCREALTTLQVADIHNSITIEESNFHLITYPIKRAAKRAGLAFRAGCLQTENNRLKCKYIFLPGVESQYLHNGRYENIVRLSHIRIFKIDIKQSPEGIYKLLPLYDIPEEMSFQSLAVLFLKIAKDRDCIEDVTIGEESLVKFFKYYCDCLIKIGIIERLPIDTLCGWKLFDRKLGHIDDSMIVRSIQIPKDCDNLLPQIMYPAESIWFSAAMFSLLKPLFQLCKVKCDTGFVMQILLDSKIEPNSSKHRFGLWILEYQARLWCNYREWPKMESNDKGAYPCKFRNRYHELPLLADILHKGFPVVIFNFKRRDVETDEVEHYLKGASIHLKPEALNYLCTAECLPVLLSANPPRKAYSKKRCLTLSPDIPESSGLLHYYAEGNPSLRQRHENINSYYLFCMDALDGLPIEVVSTCLKKSYCKALAALGTTPEEKSDRQAQLACLLGTLYFIRETLQRQGKIIERMNHRIHAFEKEIGIVTLQDFADFLNELLQESDSKVVFGQDKDGIYLYFQKYWPAFQLYCKRNHISLSGSAATFRREVLIPNRLIRPQYTPSSGVYVRYDYRKKLGGREATVLNLSLDVLKYSSY